MHKNGLLTMVTVEVANSTLPIHDELHLVHVLHSEL